MAYRSIAVNETPANPIVIDKPAGVLAGDILVAFIIADTPSANINPWPTDFVEVTGSPWHATADNQTLMVAIKVAGGSEGASYSFPSDFNIIGGIAAFSGCASTQPHQVSGAENNSANGSPWAMTSPSFPSNTTVACDMVFIAGSDITSSGDVVHTGPTGYEVRADIDSGFFNAMLSTKDAVASGATGALTGTGTRAGNTAGWDAVALALELTVAATAALTGTATASITEADVRTGGKTIILTLTDDTFIAAT